MKLVLPENEAAELSREWHGAPDKFLARRRGIAGLALLAAGAMGLIALYQLGILKHLPEPPLPKLDADRVDASADAYERLATPDAVLGLGSYAMTMGLAAMGGKHRAQKQPWIPLAMAGKVLFDAAQAGRMIRVQWKGFQAFCFWCLLAAGATFASVPLAFSEAREAWRKAKG